jgi:hypothetical protein
VAAIAYKYSWFHVLFPTLARAYCLTLVRGLTPAQLLIRLSPTSDTQPKQITGVDQLVKASGPGFVAVTQVGNWALAVEPDGVLGTTESRMRSVSEATRLISHSRDASAVGRFCWLENGSARLCFDPLFPARRSGAEAHDFVDLMRDVGFNVDGEDEYREATHAEAAFALAEELTGVRITPELLDEAPYECAVVP